MKKTQPEKKGAAAKKPAPAKKPAKKAVTKKKPELTPPPEPAPRRIIIGDHEAGHHYGVTEKTIYNWRKDGMPAKSIPGNRWEYDLDQTDPWVLNKQATGDGDPEVIAAKRELIKEKARKARADANIRDREDELAEGNILDRPYYELFIAELIQEARDAILRVPAFFHNHLCKKCQSKISELRTQLETALTSLARLKDGPEDDEG
jgi:phage terminase Nu1 subunit (DNA packaging protein)